MKIEAIAYHRNGICGEGFHVVLFVQDKRRYLATMFQTAGQVAVLDRDILATGNVRFGENSWRGDHFEDDLRRHIAAWTEIQRQHPGGWDGVEPAEAAT